jgi:phage shock protein A
MDSYTERYRSLQMAMSNQIGDLEGTARSNYNDAVSKIMEEYNTKKQDALNAYEYLKDKKDKVDTSIKDIGTAIEGSTLGRKLLGDSIKKLKDKFKSAKQSVQDKVDEVKGKVESKIDEVKGKVDDVKNQVSNKVDELKEKGSSIQEDIESKVGNVEDKVNDVKSNLESGIEDAKSKVADIGEQVESKVGDVTEQVSSKVADVGEQVSSKVGMATNALENATETGVPQLSGGFEVPNYIGSAGKGGSFELTDLSAPAENTFQAPRIAGSLNNEGMDAEQIANNELDENIFQKAFNPIRSGFNKVKGAIQNKLQSIGQKAGEVQSKVESAGNQMEDQISNLKSTASDVAEQAESKVSDIGDIGEQISSKAGTIAEDAGGEIAEDVGETVGEGIAEELPEIGGEVAAEVGAGAFLGPVGEAVALVAGAGTAIYGIVNTAMEVSKDLQNPTKKIETQEKQKLASINPNVDLTGKFVSPNSVSIYNEQTHFSGF